MGLTDFVWMCVNHIVGAQFPCRDKMQVPIGKALNYREMACFKVRVKVRLVVVMVMVWMTNEGGGK